MYFDDTATPGSSYLLRKTQGVETFIAAVAVPSKYILELYKVSCGRLIVFLVLLCLPFGSAPGKWTTNESHE